MLAAATHKTAVERKQVVRERALAARQKMRERIVATSQALADARAEVAATRKRQALLLKMAEKKAAAVAAFVEKWSKKEMARIDKAMKPKKQTKRRS